MHTNCWITVCNHVNLLCEYMLAAFFHPNFMFRSLSPLSDPFPPTEISDEGLARPVVAGIVATICFLAAAILFSTLAACFVNKQHRRKLKRKRGESFKTPRHCLAFQSLCCIPDLKLKCIISALLLLRITNLLDLRFILSNFYILPALALQWLR